jgi:hypothetical protein
MLLIGYILVVNLDFITDQDKHREKTWEVYHATMHKILAS